MNANGYGLVHSTLEKFENAALFLRLGLLTDSLTHSLIPVAPTGTKGGRLGLPSALIRHENGAFRKRSSNRRNLKTPALRFSVDGKHFENGAFRKP